MGEPETDAAVRSGGEMGVEQLLTTADPARASAGGRHPFEPTHSLRATDWTSSSAYSAANLHTAAAVPPKRVP